MPKENPTDQDIKQQPINAPRWDDTPPVRLIGWISEVRQIALKEEGIDLKGHARRLEGKVACLSYAEGSCCVM